MVSSPTSLNQCNSVVEFITAYFQNSILISLFHRKSNSFSIDINLKYLHFDMLMQLNDLRRIAHKPVRELTDMHQSILLYTNIHKDTEPGNIRYNSREYRSNL